MQRSPTRYVLGLATAACAAFAHPSAGLFALALLFAPFLCDPRGRTLPWRPPLWFVLAAALGLVVSLGGWAQWVWGDYLERKAGGSAGHFALTLGWYFTPLVALAALAGTWLAWRRRLAVERLASWVCALVLATAFAASSRVVVSAQYVFVLLPWVALLASVPLFDDSLRLRWRRSLALFLAIFAALDLSLYFSLRHGDRPRWNEAYAWVWEQRGRDDLVLGMAWPSGEYYLAPGSTELRVPRGMARLSAFHAQTLSHWPRHDRRQWFVVNHEDLLAWESADREQLLALLEQQCKKVRTFPVLATPRNLDVDVYVRE